MTNKIDYKNVLNPAQFEAVMTVEGPVLVIAGAGSGKTRTLVYRVARLVEKGVPPEAILLLTFTRKASQEMLERAAELSDARCRLVSGGTFHSLAHRLLREYAGLLGFSNSFSILDRSDMEEIIKSLIPELHIARNMPRFPKRGTLANILSKSANLQKPISEFITEEYGQFIELASHISSLTRLYTEYKKKNQLMDYDDLILNLRKLLVENAEVCSEMGQRYRYVMVDEYQDTNTIQADIVKWLVYAHGNIMVVGDDSQSIYSFRGANYRNMFDFPEQFPEAKLIKLEENYRSTQPILTFTNSLMEQAGEQFTKCLFTQRKGGERPKVVDTRTAHGQAVYISSYIKEQVEQGIPLDNFAVLFRAAYHSFELEAELARQGVSYIKYGGFKFLESAHIKDFLAHLRVIANKDDTVSWIRVLRLIKNVGQVKTHAIINWMKTNQILPEHLSRWPGAGKRDNGLKHLSGLMTRIVSKDMEPERAVEEVMGYYTPILMTKFDNYPKRQKELEQLIPMAGRYRKLSAFLDDLALEPPNSTRDINSPENIGTLTLSTVHSAKGLEWPVVFIIWVMEGRFPPSRAYNDPQALEEERRLMYVAATRARNTLIISYPGKEVLPAWSDYGGAGFKNGLSSFIQRLPEGVVSYESGNISGRAQRSNFYRFPKMDSEKKLNGLSHDNMFNPGEKVIHPAFGPGIISKLTADNKIEVLFRDAGKKLLHLKHTTLTKI